MQVKEKTIVVTGGASGLGLACVKRLLSEGANLVIADICSPNKEDLAAWSEKNWFFLKTDVTSEESVRALLEAAVMQFSGLHGLINCAGIGTPGKLLDKEGVPLEYDLFKKVLEVNTLGSFNMMRLVAEAIVKNKPKQGEENGVFINTASVAAFDGQIGQVAYAASKGAIVAMALPLARELARYGIRVMTIAPGIFDTPMLAGLPEKARASLGTQVPFPSRLGTPEEFADLAFSILSNSMLNGEVIRLDGAIRMAPK